MKSKALPWLLALLFIAVAAYGYLHMRGKALTRDLQATWVDLGNQLTEENEYLTKINRYGADDLVAVALEHSQKNTALSKGQTDAQRNGHRNIDDLEFQIKEAKVLREEEKESWSEALEVHEKILKQREEQRENERVADEKRERLQSAISALEDQQNREQIKLSDKHFAEMMDSKADLNALAKKHPRETDALFEKQRREMESLREKMSRDD